MIPRCPDQTGSIARRASGVSQASLDKWLIARASRLSTRSASPDEVSVSFVRLEGAAQNGESDIRQAPSITVVVCTRDRLRLLESCLVAVLRQTYPRFDVLVVDNGTACHAREICERLGVQWLLAPVPGLTRARNIGVRAAHGELIAFIDDDSIVEDGWLDALVAAFVATDAAAVSGKVRYMHAIDDTRGMSGQEADGQFVRAPAIFDRTTPGWFVLACFGGMGDGGNMAFRRSALLDGLQFDERIGRGSLLDSGDEHVLFAKMIARGLRIVHAPEAVVRHPSPSTPGLQAVRRYTDLRSSISHLLFVWGEFPAYRGQLIRFLLRALGRRIAPRKTSGVDRAIGSLSGWLALRAMLEGARVYWQARAQWDESAGGGSEERRRGTPAFVESTPGSH